MFMFQDDKDKLRDELSIINRKIGELKGMQDFQKHRIDKLEEGITVVMNTYPHGAKKDGTPRAKPGRKPREQR
jgi:hypothetical protein